MDRLKQKRSAPINRIEVSFSNETLEFLAAIFCSSQKLDAVIDMLKPLASVPADLLLAKEELSMVHELINNLNRKVEEGLMGLKEDSNTLNDRLDRAARAVETIAADVTALKDELKELNENTSIDLGPAIAKAEGIEARLLGIAGPNIGSDPEAPVEPTADDSQSDR